MKCGFLAMLPKLTELDLESNEIESAEEIKPFVNHQVLKVINLRGNSIMR